MIYKLVKFLSSKDLKTFIISILFHFSLYFSTSNKVTFLLSLLLLVVLYQHLKKIPLTLFYVFIIMLPFAKGKGIDILLLDKKFVLKNALFNIDYLFPIYISSFYLGLLYIYFIRAKLFLKNKKIKISNNNKIIISIFLSFILVTAMGSISNIFEIPILLSSVQLIVLLLIFFTPFIVKSFNNKLNDLYMIIASSTMFQSVWLIFQTLNKGYLQKDIESILSTSEFGARSSENQDLIRLPGTFFESSILGTFLLTNLSILLFVYINHKVKNKNKRNVILITIILSLFAILLTGSRAIYFILLVLFLLLAKNKNIFKVKTIKKTLQALIKNKIFIPIVILGIIFVSPYLINRLGSANQLFSKEGSGTYRIQLTQYAIRLVEKKPLLGVGLNLSPYYLATSFPQEDYFVDPAHPHNIIIQILAETGLIGISLFLFFIYLLFRPLLKNSLRNINEFSLASGIFFLCAQAYPIFINQMEIISYFFLYLGFMAYKNQENE